MAQPSWYLAGVEAYNERDATSLTYDQAVAVSDPTLTDKRAIQQGTSVGIDTIEGAWVNANESLQTHIPILAQDGLWPLHMPNTTRLPVKTTKITYTDERDRFINAILAVDLYARVVDHFLYAPTLTANTVAMTPVTEASAYTQVGAARHTLITGSGIQLVGNSEWQTALTEAATGRSSSQCLDCWAVFTSSNTARGAVGLRTLGSFDEQPLGSSGCGFTWQSGTVRGLKADDSTQGGVAFATGTYLAYISVRRGVGRLRLWYNASAVPRQKDTPILRFDSLLAPSTGTLGMAISVHTGSLTLQRWWCQVYGI